MAKTLITCDCLGTQAIDTDALSNHTGQVVRRPCSALCTSQINLAAEALSDPEVVFCCTQETQTFTALAEEIGVAPPAMIDLRDRGGWTTDSASTIPKMSALISEAMLPPATEKSVDIISEGLCLILGSADVALEAAEQLKDHLGVTVLIEEAETLPDHRGFDVILGNLRKAQGALGQFDVVIDGLQQIVPGGRGTFTLTEPQNGGHSQCDIILDLRGSTPLFPAPEKREGYLRADPTHAPSVAASILAASHLVGTFEKPLFVRTEALLCAHSRAEQTGCSRCLDLCPTGAISPEGDHITVDPMICAGCGACSAVCPSGAISYDAPSVDLTFNRIQTLAKAYLEAGGHSPRLLVHDSHGAEMIRLAARYSKGLPADVIPLELSAIGVFGHAETVAALAAGFASVTLLPGPGADRTALDAQIALSTVIGGADRVTLLDSSDPDEMSEYLFAAPMLTGIESPVRPIGRRRQITRQAARALNPGVDHLPLPADAPYGAVVVNTENCTLCLSCVSLCPSGALADNPDLPQLRFQEDACLQCGLCANICPENAITLEPRLDLTEAALRQEVLNEEEPFACIECGTLFGVKSTIERITEKLTNHSMFADPEKLRMIQMCDDCRVNAQYHSKDNPFTAGERPKVRTSEDYFSKRRDH